MNKLILILLLGCISISTTLFAQKNVYGYPKKYERPVDPYDDNSIEEFTSERVQKEKNRKKGWSVTIDRNGVFAKKEPNTSAADQSGELPFGKSYYVVDKRGRWYKLVSAVVDGTRIKPDAGGFSKIGWVHEDNLLLWNVGLMNPRTGIQLKCLLLNKFDGFAGIPCDNKDRVKVFLDSNGEETKDNITIYRFYFVYKKEGDRYLLGNSPYFSGGYDEEGLLGWVEKSRLAEWDSRIAVEPNFTQAGYNERKAKPNYRVVGFKNPISAGDWATQGVKADDQVSWKRDPVDEPQSILSTADPKRFKGDFMRFPLLSIGGEEGKVPYYSSAVCDDIIVKVKCKDGKIVTADKVDQVKHIGGVKILNKYQQAIENYTIMFVIEASPDLQNYQDQIANLYTNIRASIKNYNAEAKIKIGALTYRDFSESTNPENLINFLKPSAEENRFERFILSTNFSNTDTNADFPVQYFGIQKAIEVANFNPLHTNMLIVIGDKGDFTYDRGKRRMDTSAKISTSALSDAINAGNINIISLQTKGKDLEAYKSFPRKLRGLITDAARKNYNQKFISDSESQDVFDKIGYIPQSPEMDDPDENVDSLSFSLINGTIHADIFRMPVGKSVGTNLSVLALNRINIVVQKSIAFYKQLESVKYNEIDVSGFTPKEILALVDLYNQTNNEIDWRKEKFELYNKVFFAKKPSDAKEPSFSYVLFWTDRDIRGYYQIFLERFANDVGSLSISQKRERLVESYTALVDEFIGGDVDIENYSEKEIYNKIFGLKLDDIPVPNLEIGEITNPKEVTDRQIEERVKRLIQVKNNIREILDGNVNEFVFKRNLRKFYWTKIEDIF